MSVATLKIAVIGGGISGLSVAYYDPGQWVRNSPAIAWHNQDALVGARGAHD